MIHEAHQQWQGLCWFADLIMPFVSHLHLNASSLEISHVDSQNKAMFLNVLHSLSLSLSSTLC